METGYALLSAGASSARPCSRRSPDRPPRQSPGPAAGPPVR
ncbi:hypothetical protein ABZ858_23675 [Streptomyces sp. NPDC047017]